MDKLDEIVYALLPWISLVVVIVFFSKLTGWARKRKGAAIAVGLLVQMFIPDPKVQETIQVIVKQKQQQIKKQQENGEPEIEKLSSDA